MPIGGSALEWTIGGVVLVVILGGAALAARRQRAPFGGRKQPRDAAALWMTSGAGERPATAAKDGSFADAENDPGGPDGPGQD